MKKAAPDTMSGAEKATNRHKKAAGTMMGPAEKATNRHKKAAGRMMRPAEALPLLLVSVLTSVPAKYDS